MIDTTRFCGVSKGLVLFLAVGLLASALAGCGGGQSADLKACIAREAALSGQLSECQASSATIKQTSDAAQATIDAAQATIRTLTDEKTALQQRADALERENTELKQTPAAVSQEILATADSASTIDGIDAVLASISAFADRFPGAVEYRALSRRIPVLKKARAALVAREEEAKAMQAISDIRNLLSGVVDGSELSAAEMGRLAKHLADKGIKYSAISKMPRGSFAEAMKDPDAERGKSIIPSGRIIQITKEGDFYTGLLCSGDFCDRVYHFVTMGTTNGLNQGSYATLAGIITQRYSYSNAGGGTTHSLAVVGYFKGQE